MNGDVIVVGGCGLLGTVLTQRLLAQGWRVLVIDAITPAVSSAQANYLRADIRNRAALLRLADIFDRQSRAPRPWVINLAARQYQNAIPRRDRAQWFTDTNVDGALNVCAFAVKLGAAGLVQFSTDMVYGKPRTRPIMESHAQHPIGEYGLSKMHMERQVREHACAHDLAMTVFRPRLIVGKGRLGIFTKLFSLISRNWPLPLIGAGKNFYQMVSVDDCAAAVLCAINKGCPNTAYNLSSEATLCVRELMRALIQSVGSKSILIPTPTAFTQTALRALAMVGVELLYPEQYQLANQHVITSIDKARTELDWHPHGDDLSLLVDAYRWWAQHYS